MSNRGHSRMKVALLLLLGSLFSLFAVLPAFGQIVAGTITTLNGNASITRAGRSFPANYSAPVDVADQIVTSPNGRLTITLVDRSQLELAESTTLLISTAVFDRNGTRTQTTLTLLDGLVRSLVRITTGVPPNYGVHTPNAVAAARGTTYDTYYTNNETRPGFESCKEFTDVSDYDGVVEVRSLANPSSPPVLLHSGQKTTVPCGLAAVPATAIGASGSGIVGGTGAVVAGILAMVGSGVVGGYAAAGGFDPSGSSGATRGAPEIDPGMMKSGLVLLIAALLIAIERIRRH
jgi:FecR protein